MLYLAGLAHDINLQGRLQTAISRLILQNGKLVDMTDHLPRRLLMAIPRLILQN